jgi:hypothetical protein
MGNSELICIKIKVVILLLLSKNVNCSSFDSVHESWTDKINEHTDIIGQLKSPNQNKYGEYIHQNYKKLLYLNYKVKLLFYFMGTKVKL